MNEERPASIDLAKAREALAGKRGQEYWRSLEQLAETPEFRAWVDDEFPGRATLAQIDRRTILKFMGASMALAGLAGCRGMFLDEPRVVPYVKAPEELVPGKPLFYASTFSLGGYGVGVLVESHEGRPTKIEGNPDHPASLGACNPWMQASILGLYDPDRSQNVTSQGDISTWNAFFAIAREALEKQKAKGGAGIRLLTETVTSPTLARQIGEFLAAYPKAHWHQYEPGARDSAYEGTMMAFGQPVETVYDLSKANRIVSLDADFLTSMPGSLVYSRQFADGRRLTEGRTSMSRLYMFESGVSVTGANADHRWPVKPSEIGAIAAELLAALSGKPATGPYKAQIEPIARDLKAQNGATVVIPGDDQPAALHATCHSINEVLGSKARQIVEPVAAKPVNHTRSLSELCDAMKTGSVDALFILGGNPAYDAPADFGIADALAKVKLKVRHGLYEDETSALCDWHVPATHYLEHWSDARAFDGTASIVQPLTAPLFDGRSDHQLLAGLMGKPDDGHDLVQETWKQRGIPNSPFPNDFEKSWREVLHAGFVPGTAAKLPTESWAGQALVKMKKEGILLGIPDAPQRSGGPALEVAFRLDPALHDGRFNNLGWLQELPRPITQNLWDNAALMGIGAAEKLGVEAGDMVEITVGGRTIKVAAMPQPGHPEGSITIHLGWGRTKAGTVGNGTGFDAYPLRTSARMGHAGGAQIKKIDGFHKVQTTQMHHQMESYGDKLDIIRTGALADYAKHPSSFAPTIHESPGPVDEALEKSHHPGNDQNRQEQPAITMYEEEVFKTNLPQWGMTIDLNSCIGCNACVTACQAENNVPVVGKTQVGRGREMHWLRIDRYYGPRGGQGSLENPDMLFQPMMCGHCEIAPCEPVCPVGATLHSHEGLNQMVYNRCVGTRYCSNNCPYKVRRFNFFNFTDNQDQFSTQTPPDVREPKHNGIQLLKMLNNPNVTVRGRGVMEKCTYCVQRINDARIEAKKGGRPIADGDIVTACQQACPARAITFGNIADKQSAVAKLKREPRAYRLLEELNTRPRTSYLSRVRNPNPEVPA
ncbi:MAG: TAT-variant-translocated molybdopterin oxidoreductase [Fimbriimonas ginsengisoli]|uniref:TAT-variant-translocated molybdopterin oxidoreductase n=1 Tax=Fimbriimonas ginsengisoli TaxID=1005039 RepID=A0A931LV86_FIMGI|nr:TAT-variant-translocated molybdopterin oxidoreductase [Fimbriimonas ginsengisoli]